MTSPLDKFLHKPDPSASQPDRGLNQAVVPAPRPYEAFKAAERPLPRLDIRRVSRRGGRMPAYSRLRDVLYVHSGQFIGLIYEHVIIEMMGRNLGKLVGLLQNDRADWVQEFDPERWGEPPNDATPVILSMEITEIVQGQAQPPIDPDARH